MAVSHVCGIGNAVMVSLNHKGASSCSTLPALCLASFVMIQQDCSACEQSNAGLVIASCSKINRWRLHISTTHQLALTGLDDPD